MKTKLSFACSILLAACGPLSESDGELSRQEQDTSGDGFRDLVAFYGGGRLDREEQDRDGDGQADVTTHYDADERLARREEDTDGDGQMDRISFYENGRLTRRQLLSPDADEGDTQARSDSGGR